MAIPLYADNTHGTIASGITSVATTITLTTGHGVRFPAVTTGFILYATLLNAGNVVEQIHITAHTADSDTLTVTRAANGTTGKAWTAGDRIECRLTSENMTAIQRGTIYPNSQSADYTTVLADEGSHIFHPSADTTARTYTIAANSSVAYPIGATLTFVNQNGAGVITIAITSDTMRLAGTGATGNRSLAADGIATALKVTSTEWIISGTGVT